MRNLSRKFKRRTDTIKDENGQILCDGDNAKERWRECYSELYKKNENITSQAVDMQNNENEPPPLLREVEEAIKGLKNEKSPGDDEVTAELIKNGGENVVLFYHKLCTKIWIEKQWPEDCVNSMFLPFPKSVPAQILKRQ